MTANLNPYQWISSGTGPLGLYPAQTSRNIDTAAAQYYRIPGVELMQRAGRAAFACLSDHWPHLDSITLLCGTGNNGGDGFIVARLAAQAFEKVEVLLVGLKEQVTGDARIALQQLDSTQASIRCFTSNDRKLLDQIKHSRTQLWVDALFGSGLNRTLDAAYISLITQVNQHSAPIFSLDLPSGIHPDTGIVLGAAIDASATLSFITLKPGQFRDAGKAHCGQLALARLNVEDTLIAQHPCSVTRLHVEPDCLPKLRSDVHKGTQGTLVCIGGNQGMGGAILLAAQAALHTGVGKIYVVTRAEHQTAMLTRQPELMWLNPEDTPQIQQVLQSASAVMIGPGLGQDTWAHGLLDQISALTLPVIADADALNLLAKRPLQHPPLKTNTLIITPHPGEAKRLVHRYCAHVTALEPFQVARTLADQLNAFTVLKGAGTIISAPNPSINPPMQFICDAGNPGMAKAGMGDVLAGTIAGLVAQSRFMPLEAIQLGVWLHATAADRIATEQGIYNLLPDKLPDAIGHGLNKLSVSLNKRPVNRRHPNGALP